MIAGEIRFPELYEREAARTGGLPLHVACVFERGGIDPMALYYFDVKDGVPVRRRGGLQFPKDASAIEYSQKIARQLRGGPRNIYLGLYISVINESGAELHREQVYKGADRQEGKLSSRA